MRLESLQLRRSKAAAQVYFYCRLIRKSRSHLHVQLIIKQLLQIVFHMSTSSPFFTRNYAQERVFVAAIVAVELQHCDIVQTWFEELCHGTRGVSHLM